MDINYLTEGLQVGELSRINKINKLYSIYESKQGWAVNSNLDYVPTQKITNYIKKIIDKKARFMFGREPFFNLVGEQEERVQEKEDLLQKILDDNLFHKKLLKARKDCSIGGKVALKIWADRQEGIKLIFSPAQEFVATYNIDDVDKMEKVIFFYNLNDDTDRTKQRIKKQVWELVEGRCIVNEGIYDGYGKVIEKTYTDYYNGLDFIPVIIIQNGGLTGDTSGYSDVELLWQDQDQYNKLSSDDIDALKFQMFGQTVISNASEETIESITIAPGALVDLQTDVMQAGNGQTATATRLESNFTYEPKFKETIDRLKSNMYDLMDVPDTSLEQLRGLMASGKSMKAIYWDLMAICDEDWTEWGPALTTMVDYIFKMIETYNLYNSRNLAKVPASLVIEKYYPLPEDEIEQRKMDLDDVTAGTMSKKAYMEKWKNIENIDAELEQIAIEKQQEDNYFNHDLNGATIDLNSDETAEDDATVTEEEKGEVTQLNGAQIGSLIRIIESVVQGILDYETAIDIVKIAFNFDEETARKVLGKQMTEQEKQQALENM